MDDVTASIVINCLTGGASAAISKLGFNISMLAKKGAEFGLEFAQSCLSSFNQAQDISWKFGKTFRNTLGTATKAVKDFSSEYNLATATAQNMLTSTASLLKGFGFSEKDALTMSEQVSRMGVDLASFTGVAGGAEEAVNSIVAAMTGNTRLMQKYGTLIHTDSAEFRDLTKSIMENKGATEDQARAMAVFEIIMKRNKDAIGDYKAEGENWTQSQNNLKESLRELEDTIGKLLYDILGLNSATQSADNILKTITDTLKENSPEITYYGKTIMNVVYTVCEIAWQLLADTIGKAIKRVKFFIETAQAIIQDFPGFMKAVWEDIKTNADNLWNFMIVAIRSAFEAGTEIISSFIVHFKDIFLDLGQIAIAWGKGLINAVKEAVYQIIKLLGTLGKSFWNLITGQEKPSEILENIKNTIGDGIKSIKDEMEAPFKEIKLHEGTKEFLADTEAALKTFKDKTGEAGAKFLADYGKNTKEWLASHGVEIPDADTLFGIPDFGKIKKSIEDFKARQAKIEAERGKKPEEPKDKPETPPAEPEPPKEPEKPTQVAQELPENKNKVLGDFSLAKLTAALGNIGAPDTDANNPQKTTANNSKKQTTLLTSLDKKMTQVIEKLGGNLAEGTLVYT